MRNLQQTFIPLFAILLLTATSLTNLFSDSGQPVVQLLLYLLYICAALMTLAALAAVAHAREFSADLVFAAAVFLFCLSSVIGQLLGNLLDDELYDTVVIVVTMLYAFVVMIFSYLRWQRVTQYDLATLASPALEHATGIRDATDEAPTKSAVDKPNISQRCQELAIHHRLTRREVEILLILAEGHGGSYVSEVLFISPNTARTHIRNIYKKLGVSTREDILRICRASPLNQD